VSVLAAAAVVVLVTATGMAAWALRTDGSWRRFWRAFVDPDRWWNRWPGVTLGLTVGVPAGLWFGGALSRALWG
jgi:hypothetical protein